MAEKTETKRRRLTPEEIEKRAEAEKARAQWLRVRVPALDEAREFYERVRKAKTREELSSAYAELGREWPLREAGK